MLDIIDSLLHPPICTISWRDPPFMYSKHIDNVPSFGWDTTSSKETILTHLFEPFWSTCENWNDFDGQVSIELINYNKNNKTKSMDKIIIVHAEWHDIRIRHIRVRTRTRSNITMVFFSDLSSLIICNLLEVSATTITFMMMMMFT
jgi:hypothetical protein